MAGGAVQQRRRSRSFSALQRAENSSMLGARGGVTCFQPFQCSSASRKFLNFSPHCGGGSDDRFQCSSASRKFLNGG